MTQPEGSDHPLRCLQGPEVSPLNWHFERPFQRAWPRLSLTLDPGAAEQITGRLTSQTLWCSCACKPVFRVEYYVEHGQLPMPLDRGTRKRLDHVAIDRIKFKMETLIYLHGLNSSSLSHKAEILRHKLAPVAVVAPSYPAHRPDDAIAVLSDFFEGFAGQFKPLVVGSSMGGFYGQYLARHYPMTHLFMINPALRPWDLLTEFLGQRMATAEGAEYPIDDALIEHTRKYGIEDPCVGIATTLFLDAGDQVIDYRIAESIYAICGRVIVFEGGDHAFQHLDEAIKVIREFL